MNGFGCSSLNSPCSVISWIIARCAPFLRFSAGSETLASMSSIFIIRLKCCKRINQFQLISIDFNSIRCFQFVCHFVYYVKIHLRLPWNQSTLFGYLAEVFYGTFLCEVFIVATGSVLCLFMSMSWHHEAFYFMFRHSIRKLDSPVNQDNEKIVSDLVRFHIMAKE